MHGTPAVNPPNERRHRQRFGVNVPFTVKLDGLEVQAHTRDLSENGVYFYLTASNHRIVESAFEFVVDMPPEITLSASCRIQGHAQSIRVEEGANNLTGVAAQILDYSIFRDCA